MSIISTPDLSDEHPEVRAIELQFVNYGASKSFSGEAVTIKCHEDNSLVKACVAEQGHGRVIVVDGGGSLGMSGRRLLLRQSRNRTPLGGHLHGHPCPSSPGHPTPSDPAL